MTIKLKDNMYIGPVNVFPNFRHRCTILLSRSYRSTKSIHFYVFLRKRRIISQAWLRHIHTKHGHTLKQSLSVTKSLNLSCHAHKISYISIYIYIHINIYIYIVDIDIRCKRPSGESFLPIVGSQLCLPSANPDGLRASARHSSGRQGCLRL